MTLKTLNRLALGAALPALLFAAAPAFGQPGPAEGGGDPAQFLSMDADGDGAVTLDEMAAARDMRFSQADADGDGALSPAEAEAFFPARPERPERPERPDRFAMHDADGDGRLTSDELGARQAEMFSRLDADADGRVTAEEIDSAREAMRARMRERMRGRDGG